VNVQEFVTYARKFVVALVAAAGVLIITLTSTSDGGSAITPSEWLQIAVAFLGAVGVYSIPNGKVVK
jgi:hypothetical protein